jgi:hypothetical protein
MAQGRIRAKLAVGCLLAWGGTAAAQKGQVSADDILRYRPKQDGVTVTTPTGAEAGACKVEVVKGANNTSAWLLTDGQGRMVRRFADTKGDGKVDTYSYYLDGQEVYREIDTDGNRAADQFRWFGAQGMRWGVDVNQDGRIDGWQQISAEEVSQEIMRAVITRDPARLQALALRDEEIKALQLPAAEATRLRDSVSQIGSRFQAVLAKSGTISDKARWLHLETQAPQCIPADAAGGKYELIRYRSGTIVYESGGKAELMQTGEMIQVGRAWRIVTAPTPGAAEPEGVAGGDGGGIVFTKELEPLIEKLREIDAHAPKPTDTPAAVVRYNLERATVLERIAAQLRGKDAEQWVRQMADCLSAAAQSSPQGDNVAYRRLAQLRDQAVKAQPGSPLAGYITFREMSAEYASQLAKPDQKDLAKVQDAWRDKLKKFVEEFPTADDTPDAILQLAMVSEFSNKETEAKNWYEMLARNHTSHPLARKAQGALRRLNLDGQPLELAGPTLAENRPFDIRSLAGKVVVVYYWASWNQQCAADFFKLKTLMNTHGSKGLEVVCVNLDNTPAEAMTYLQKTPTPGTHVNQPPGGLDSPLAVNYGVMVLPNLFLVGRDGKVVSHTIQMSGLEDEIKKLMDK